MCQQALGLQRSADGLCEKRKYESLYKYFEDQGHRHVNEGWNSTLRMDENRLIKNIFEHVVGLKANHEMSGGGQEGSRRDLNHSIYDPQ